MCPRINPLRAFVWCVWFNQTKKTKNSREGHVRANTSPDMFTGLGCVLVWPPCVSIVLICQTLELFGLFGLTNQTISY